VLDGIDEAAVPGDEGPPEDWGMTEATMTNPANKIAAKRFATITNRSEWERIAK